MTRLKVVNTLTNSTYYLNNVDVSCAKLYSFIGKTDYRNTILHTPLPHLKYSIEYSYNTNIDELNALYKHDLSADFSGYFPEGHGIILSELLLNPAEHWPTLSYITDKIHCENISLTTTTYWCPPVIKRGNLQSSRITSFSYIHKNWYSNLFGDENYIFIVYNNKNLSNVNSDHIFGLFPSNAFTMNCNPKYYCPSGAIGVCSSGIYTDNSCNQLCNSNSRHSPCKNYNDLCNNNVSKDNNELIIKSWNYNPKSSMSGRGVIYNASMDKWIAQTPNPESRWGWNDVSNLSKNENIPLLAFGITIPDKSNLSQTDILNIKHLYAELSNNLEPSFNEYRRNSNPPIPLMPYHIGLDISCLTRPDCSNPFFDLSLILNLKS